MDPTAIVDAKDNWWGDLSGPYHPTLNPDGLGDEVSNYVSFMPWFTLVGVEPDLIPPAVGLLQVYPNPFNPQTTVLFSLERAAVARVEVYELSGKRVAVLADRIFTGGEHSLLWNGRDFQGRAMPSGTYVVRLETGDTVEAQKISLMK